MASTTAPGQGGDATSNPQCRKRCSDEPSHAASAYPSHSSRPPRCASGHPKSSPAPVYAEPERRPGNGCSKRAAPRSCDPPAQSPTARPSDPSSIRIIPSNRSRSALESPRESNSPRAGIAEFPPPKRRHRRRAINTVTDNAEERVLNSIIRWAGKPSMELLKMQNDTRI